MRGIQKSEVVELAAVKRATWKKVKGITGAGRKGHEKYSNIQLEVDSDFNLNETFLTRMVFALPRMQRCWTLKCMLIKSFLLLPLHVTTICKIHRKILLPRKIHGDKSTLRETLQSCSYLAASWFFFLFDVT